MVAEQGSEERDEGAFIGGVEFVAKLVSFDFDEALGIEPRFERGYLATVFEGAAVPDAEEGGRFVVAGAAAGNPDFGVRFLVDDAIAPRLARRSGMPPWMCATTG